MKRTTEEMIVKSINEGYEKLAAGEGKYDEYYQSLFNGYRAEGYDVRSWRLRNEDGSFCWVIYGKMKKSAKKNDLVKIEVQVDFSSMTVKELKKVCQEKKITGYSKMNKVQMIESLKKAC